MRGRLTPGSVRVGAVPDAIGVVAVAALAGGLDKGTAGDRYQAPMVPSLWTGIHGTVGALCEPYGTRLRVHVRLGLARNSNVNRVAPVVNDDGQTALKFASAFSCPTRPLRLIDTLSRADSAALCKVPFAK